MKVILTTNIKKLGNIGDLVNVKSGYARNYLFPNKMALRDSKTNKEYYEKIKDEMEEKELSKKEDANKLIKDLEKLKIKFSREADDKDQLYGSISKKEIIDYLSANNINIKSDDLIIKNQIKSIGEHSVEINPYVDISKEIKVLLVKN